eukprot:scaffold4015_cov200-Skeletonema_marinoi.AAC.9
MAYSIPVYQQTKDNSYTSINKRADLLNRKRIWTRREDDNAMTNIGLATASGEEATALNRENRNACKYYDSTSTLRLRNCTRARTMTLNVGGVIHYKVFVPSPFSS